MTVPASPDIPPDAQTPPGLLPDAPALVVGGREAVLVHPDGEIEEMDLRTAGQRVRGRRPLLCHARAVSRRLRAGPVAAFDVLELFAFVRPARFCLPTPRGLAEALGLERPGTLLDEAVTLVEAARALLLELARLRPDARREALGVAWAMERGGWAWGSAVLGALGAGSEAPHSANLAEPLRIWKRLPEWSEAAPEPPAGTLPVEPVEARAQLVRLLGADAEPRPQQADYASAVAAAFAPREEADTPHAVLAEAGTGVGKTLGYIAPASVWARKNGGAVWISTYTRNLQRQLDAELDRLHPDPEVKRRKVVIRKGRENYLCLLNVEEAVGRLPTNPLDAVPLGLMARWALASRDGDMQGGDFPAWLADLMGRNLTLDLTDTRGECIYSACPHYHVCFIERAIRRARRAEIVVANHALVMVQAALGGIDDAYTPTRYVFDEGHHLFDAADKAFSAHLSGRETAELRHWLLGAEAGGRVSRARGLKARVEDLVAGHPAMISALDRALHAARALPGPGWHQRVMTDGPPDAPLGPTEAFLALARRQVHARAASTDPVYGMEAETQPPAPGLPEAAKALDAALARLIDPLRDLRLRLAALLDDEAEELETATRQRIEGVVRSLERRALLPLAGWRAMLGALSAETPPQFVDWLSIDRRDGRDDDVGLHRHWIDPTAPFAEMVAKPAHGLVVTSATLRDATGDVEADWRAAEARTGAAHLPAPAIRAAVPSPFDYARQTRVFVVTDVRKDDPAQVAAAYRELFLAAGGGGLGLFTAINRLRVVHERIRDTLEDAGIPLLAQHADPLDTPTLIDIFRAEEDSCLLGTDAVRDGVDVPGRSLRLIVFDRVPWPRPTLLHKARRAAFGGRTYDELEARMRIKQAFGRLIRRAGDKGVFVLLDRNFPSRMAGAFPEGVTVERIGLAEAIRATRDFLLTEEAEPPQSATGTV